MQVKTFRPEIMGRQPQGFKSGPGAGLFFA
jgi:hypothetical protein